MRYNILSNGFITTIASCEYGLPNHLFEVGVRIRNHDLPLWEAREIVTNTNQVYHRDMEVFQQMVSPCDGASREPKRAWKSRIDRSNQLDTRQRVIDK